jgi:MscS family membrane protein
MRRFAFPLALAAAAPAVGAPVTGAATDQLPGGAAPTGAAAALREWLPDALRGGDLLGLEIWQWIGLFTVVLAGFVVDLVARPFVRWLARRLLGRLGPVPERDALKRDLRPWGLVAAGVVWLSCLPLLDFAGLARVVLVTAARVFLSLASVWAAWRTVDLVASALVERARHTASKVDDVLVPLLRRAAKLFVAALGVVYVADGLAIQIAPLLASLGLGGLAFAFAAKDTIENFFGSIAVITDRPFLVGDWVVIGDVEGTVERIGFRSTRVRTFYDSMVTIPNSTLVRATVDNYGRRRYRRIKTTLQLAYSTPPERVLAFCEGVRELLRTHPATRKDYFQVWLKDLGASSLDVLLYCFVETPDWTSELQERERLLIDVLRLAEQLGVELAFPTQTVHLRRDEVPASPHEAPAPPASDTRERAFAAGREAARSLVADRPWTR